MDNQLSIALAQGTAFTYQGRVTHSGTNFSGAGQFKFALVTHVGNSAIVSWPDMGPYILQQNGDLATTNWVTTGYAITNGFGTNFCPVTPPVANLFFRLKQ